MYYFTDVERLLEILNPNVDREGGSEEAKAAAGQARKALTEAELAVADAQADVNKYQTRVLTLDEELRQLRADNKAKEMLFGKTGGLVNRLTEKQTNAQSEYNDLKAKSEQNPDDPIAKAKADQAKKRQDDLSAHLEDAKETNANAEKDKDAAAQRLETGEDEKDGLPAKRAEAQEALEQAQANVSQKRKASFLAAQEESEAFALARDHASHLKTRPLASSTDPTRRVEIYGFDDSKSIFLRGKREDIDKVKEIIAGFDQPSPQARITLWSLELNSAGNKNNRTTKRFNEALNLIENDLAITRGLIAASLSLLRDAVNNQVNTATCPEASQLNPASPEDQRLRRILCFYAPQVLYSLGWDPAQPDEFRTVGKWMAPDPAGTTTLGEALLVLSLGRRTQRTAAWTAFETSLNTSLPDLKKNLLAEHKGSEWTPENDLKTGFLLTKRTLGLDSAPLNDDEMTAAQLEIVRALVKAGLGNLKRKGDMLFAELRSVQESLKTANARDRILLETRQDSLTGRLTLITKYLRTRVGIQPSDFGTVLDQVEKKEPLRLATPRVAAADEMLKEMMIAVEDDLDRLLVHPMLYRLRSDLIKTSGLNVGVLQRTSMLATNRLVARVDPRASAQLALGEETDILQSIMQLGEVYLAAQTAGVFGTLNVLNAQKREPPPEIYSLNTGAEFKVTPIFDPSGQALRFKFDYVAGTRIQEPNGTTNPQLPRIERHTVNTEVQISNMEIREISRYESNAKLGLPARYWGGIPILKDIPYIRPYVPLLGWFVRKAGSDSASQESILFGQTTIYPTIGEMVPLLTNPD